MVNINNVYQKVLALANKEQRGYITPQEFNLFANLAQMEIFEQYFYDLNQLSRARSNSKEYSDIVDNLNEKISFFEVINATVTSGTTLTPNAGTEVYRVGTVMCALPSGTVEIEEVQRNQLLYISKSPLTRATETRPIYVRENENTIGIYPVSIITNLITFDYVKKPTDPNWGYIVAETKALYHPTNSTDFELHPSEETELVYKILKLAGLSIKRDDLAKGGQGLESMQVQQEKQ